MANQNNSNDAQQTQQNPQNQPYQMPVDPFTRLMWGPPQGPPPFMPMPQQAIPQQMQQNQGQTASSTSNSLNTTNNFDFNKLMDSADKVFKLINQTQPMFKQLGPLLKLFK